MAHRLVEDLNARSRAAAGENTTYLFAENKGFKDLEEPFAYDDLVDWSVRRRPVTLTTVGDILTIERNTELSRAETSVLEAGTAAQIALDSLLRQARRFMLPGDEEDDRRRGREFMRHTTELFGAPDPKIFWPVYKQKREWLASLDLPEGSQAAASRELLLGTHNTVGLLPYKTENTGESLRLPKRIELDRLKAWVEANFGDLIALMGDDTQRQFGPEDMAELYNKAFGLRHMSAAGWRAELIDVKGAPYSTRTSIKRILVPSGYRSMSYSEATKKLIHEFIHAYRSHRGEQHGAVLADQGMPGNSEFEEIMCKAIETALAGKVDQSIIPAIDYLGIGLVMGLDGNKRDAEDLYPIFYHLSLIKKSLTNSDPAAQAATARSGAMVRIKSIFRGTPGDIPGVCFTHNLVYFENYQRFWDLVRKAEDLDELLDYLLSGKFNPFDATHREIMGEIPR